MKRRYARDPNTGHEYLAYVAPGSVLYHREDIDFLLPWLLNMREGVYPLEPSDGYVGGKSSRKTKAYFESICQVAAEIDRRLAMVGLDRELVEKHYCLGLTVEDLAKHYGMEVQKVSRLISSAVSYISSGPCPRWKHCVDCRQYRDCRQKKRPGMTYTFWKSHRYKSMYITEKHLTKHK